MNVAELHETLEKLDLSQRFLQREIAILKRKKISKRDPYSVLYTVLLYLYCVNDSERFVELFRKYIESEMEHHFAQIHDLWFLVERGILLYSHLTGDSKHDHRIREKGFVEERLQGSLLKTHSNNLKDELAEFHRGHALPKNTIVWRYQSLIAECVAIVCLSPANKPKGIEARLERYRQLFLAAVESFPLKDKGFMAALERVSEELA